jgi:hypothetical protein
MFIKRVEKNTLAKLFVQAIKIEKDNIRLKGNPGQDEGKASTSNKKEQDSMDMESIQRIFNKISNRIIDLKKGITEISSNKHFSNPPFKRTFPIANKPPPEPTKGMNLEEALINVLKSYTFGVDQSTRKKKQEEEGGG